MPATRPILKSLSFVSSETASNPLPFSSCPTILDSPHVHFPPTPALTSTANTHSSFMYDRAPIVVSPNICALPERGGRSFIGSNSNQGGGALGYFQPRAKFQVNAVRVERDSVEAVPPTIFSASVTVGNVNDCGSMLFMKKHSGPMYDYDYQYSSHDNQHTQHAEHVQVQAAVSSLLFDRSSDSSDLGVSRFYTSPPCIPSTPASSLSSSSSIPHSSLSISPWNDYSTSTAATPTAGSSNNNAASHSDKRVDVGGKKRKNRVGRECRTTKRITVLRPGASGSYVTTSPEFELEGCLGGF